MLVLRKALQSPIFRIPSSSSKLFATKVHRLSKPGDDDDFRPPWVYTMSSLLSYTVIPCVAVYGVFVYDFGERDHVFQPARRWAARQKAAFFTLSPAEEKLLQVEEPTNRPTEA